MSDATHQQTPTSQPRSLDGPEESDPARRLWSLWLDGQEPRVADFLEQAGIRDPEQIVMVLRVDQAERCRRGQWVSAEDYLDAFPAIRDHAESAVDLVFAEFLLREERGERPPLEEFLRRFPQYTGELNLQIELHRAIDVGRDPTALGVGSSATLPMESGAAPADQSAAYPEIPGYEILGILGRGGMGIVYRAWQAELKRLVAVKMLIAGALASPGAVARVRVEVEAMARLRHPNIVQIHGVGQYAGAPFLVLELVEGRPLAQTLAGTPQPAEWAARTVETLARAIHAAHLLGVVHRDLSPANILLTADGTPKLSDFGLAKLIIGGGSLRTQTGDLLGTPSYMAPEQAQGAHRAIGAATDIYALGAILYEMLTGRPPFKAEQPLETLRQVLSDDPVTPSRLRPKLPADLETICLKCLRKEPARRYATAEALADELQRFLQGRPIQARRSTWTERSWRWCRRNPWLAAAVLVALLGTVTVILVQMRANRALQKSNDALAAANTNMAQANADLGRSRATVQARYDLAVEAIRTFHTGVSEDFLLDQDQFQEVRDRLLKSASDFYGKLGALLGKETDPASRRAVGQASYEVAELTAKVGRPEDALAAHRQVLAARQALAAGSPADPEIQADVGRSLTAIAVLLETTGQTREAEATYRKAMTLLAELAPTIAEAPAVRVVLANCRSNLGRLLHSMGRDEEALAVYRQARADQEALTAAPWATDLSREALTSTINNVALLLAAAGGSSEAEAEYRTGLAIEQKLADEHPAVTQFRDNLAVTHSNLGNLLSNTGKVSEAAAEFRNALAIHQRLADEHPAVTQFRSHLAQSHNGFGYMLQNSGSFSEAAAEYRKALAVQQKLADDYPAIPQFRFKLARSHNNLGYMLSSAGEASEAAAEYHKALAIQQKLADDHPGIPEFQGNLALSLLRIGWQLAQAGENDEAIGYYKREEAIRRKLVEASSATPDDRDRLANCQINTADLLRRAGRFNEALAACERALAVREPLVQAHPEVPEYRANLGESYLRLGQVRHDLVDLTKATAAWKRALAHYEGTTPLNGEQTFLEACCHAGLAGLAGRAGSGVSAKEGADSAEKAMVVLRRAVSMDYRNPDAYRTESALDPLRNRSDFRDLMMDLLFPTEPFARGH